MHRLADIDPNHSIDTLNFRAAMFPMITPQTPGHRGRLAALCVALFFALSLISTLAFAQTNDEAETEVPATKKRVNTTNRTLGPKMQRARPARVVPKNKKLSAKATRVGPAQSKVVQPAPAPAPKPQPAAFRWPNEELYFSIRFNGIEAMRAILRSGDQQRAKNRDYVPISAFAQSVGFFHKVYPLVDRANTFIDPADARPIRSEKHFEERGQTRIYKVDFWADLYRAEVFKSRKTSSQRYNHAIPYETHDMLSWYYHLRARPDFKVGDKFEYYVYDGWKFSRVDMEVVGKEDVYTPMGWFKGWKIKFSRNVLTAQRRRDKKKKPATPALTMKTPNDHSGHLWVSRDANRLPIRVAIDSQFGTGIAELIKYTPHSK
ncbi:hypothetical protein DN745_06790 [Bradymonas sediminis]|uniref:DUF3108 domain-containing protein n=1 Tax=Bradymonas sediminis TaxID=1548548 RepID=A0A2Z4FK06_9DELT|nr:hypothetical protein DN745_06790 [Bradymonas sediminis]